jgi:hypothetical protein
MKQHNTAPEIIDAPKPKPVPKPVVMKQKKPKMSAPKL